MRTPLTISAIGHAAFLLWGVLSFAAHPNKTPPIEAMPIEVISASDFSQLTAGNPNGRKVETPKPVVEKVAERKALEDPNAKVEKKEIKAASDKPPPPPPAAKPEPKPEPKVEPKPEPKVEAKPEPKREAKPEPKPEPKEPKPEPKPKAVAEKKPEPKSEPKPDLIAEALKKDESKKDEAKKPEPKSAEAKKPEPKKSEPPKPEVKKAEAKKAEPKKEAKAAPRPESKKSDANADTRRDSPEFDSRNIAALLNKRTPQRLAATGDVVNSTVALGAPSGTAAQLSQSELDALRARLASLWNPPAGATNPDELVVLVRIRLRRDGTLDGPPQVLTSGRSALFTASRDSAMRAIFRGQPFNMLRPEHYEQWKDIEINFDPRDMFRG